MKLYLDKAHFIQTEEGIDLSIPLKEGVDNVNAWYAAPVEIKPISFGDFIGDVNQGGAVNFKTVLLNPHGNGTHTECVGHISSEPYTINQCLRAHHFTGDVVTIQPKEMKNEAFDMVDHVITKESLMEKLNPSFEGKVLAIRTLPNGQEKKSRQYSDSNPPYLTVEAIQYINELGVEHLMVDLPSVDREDDGGALAAHRAYWNYPARPQTQKTITELIYIPNEVVDGHYFFQIQIMSLEMDASPSKILLHHILN